MSKFYSNLLFSLVVTVVMNGLDMLYHLATHWAVHLNYVAIKLTVIFLTVWMITQFIGKGIEEGVVASIYGPFIFYIYYLFAGATLNRDVFNIDEQFWFMFLHVSFMLIAYFASYYLAKSKNYWLKTISFILTAGFTSIAFFALYIMIKMRLQGLDEETAATLMTFSLILVPALSYFAGIIIGVFIDNTLSKKYVNSLTASAVAALLIGFFWKDIAAAFFAFIIGNLAYYIINAYKVPLSNEASK